ncbi:hypothetical protein JCGZ_07609 [Jatropha curcas]|uniref:Uncharacterized protein n=1 Tax=Jatropha curcas TaxID=180498 RepID=A0A067KG93_JATCU|nr:E3 ubiquitin ligase PQT3-like isoform X1 [Jatropha curcas]KDP34038.1 hypothetical protein JCGZ_07609 [Jatropha curcas]
MAIRFRFRSSLNFDSVDIEGRPSISVGDLKAKIVHDKHLHINQDFDLVFSDAITGQEYYDENFELPSGSSVIIKRVPAGSVRSDMARIESFENLRIKEANVVKTSVPVNVEIDNFDDFGVELCPIPETTASGSDLDVDKKLYFTKDDTDNGVPRCFETPTVECQKLEASELSEANPGRPLNIGDNEDSSQIKSKPIVDVFTKPEKVVTANPQSIDNVDLPAELKCSLCDTFFKEAVMIPCCQHSFCEKCIGLVLIEKGRCPKCLSTKYGAENLLPNVSLRQAIKHFLESQLPIKSSDNAFGYAPDGESGIQVKETSCAASIHQNEGESTHSPCTTGRGSNRIIAKPVVGKSFFSRKLKQIDAEKPGSRQLVDLARGPEDFVADFQGENQPMHEAVSSIKKERASWVNSTGPERSFLETGRYRKGDRTCYLCGSPDHFIRNCPAASTTRPMLQTGNPVFPGAMPGYLSPYWNGTPFSQTRPFINPYGNPFSATMVQPSTFPAPTFMAPMFGSMAPYSGFTRMTGVASPVGPSAEWRLGHSDCEELQGYEKRQKLSNKDLGRGQFSDDDDEDNRFNKRHSCNEAKRSHGTKSRHDRDESIGHSKDRFAERPRWKCQHSNHFEDELERSSSEVEDMPSISSRHSEELQKRHHWHSKKHDGCDSSHSRRRSNKSSDVKRKRVESDAKRDEKKHHSHSESGLEPSLSGDRKTQLKERDSSHGSRHSRHNSRSNEPSHERWQMISGSDEDSEEDYHYYKQNRLY